MSRVGARRSGGFWTISILGLVLLEGPWMAQAQPPSSTGAAATVQRFEIPASSLADALIAFGMQSGLQVSFARETVAGLDSQGLKGDYGSEEALNELLQGTNLEYSLVNGSTTVIIRHGQLKGGEQRSFRTSRVTFLTLFLGLVTGVHSVEVGVSDPVAVVELYLDGRQVASITQPPWVFRCDLGESLAPHRLEAVAIDQRGEDVDRARQWVNLPRSRAEAALVLEEGGESVRLVWESMEGQQIEQARVTLDGQPLTATAGGRYRLPPHDARYPHVLEARVEFAGGLIANAEMAFGGQLGTAVSTELTAVPLSHKRRRTLPAVSDLGGLLTAAEEPAEVVAVDAAGGELVVVIDQGAHLGLGGLGLLMHNAPVTVRKHAEHLKPDERVRILSTAPARLATVEVPFELFPISQPFTSADGPIDNLITHVKVPASAATGRISDAVAVAAVAAAAGGRPRAVVLVVGREYPDGSRFSAKEVLAFLDVLGVPLHVWSTGRIERGRRSEDRVPLSHATPWGRARDISSLARLRDAVAALRRSLDSQFTAWIKGDHLPQEILVSSRDERFEKAN